VRNAALAALALVIVVAAVFYVRLAQPESAVPATPTPSLSTTAPSSSQSAPPSITATPSPPASGAVTVQVTPTAIPAEFRYLVLGSGAEFRLVVLDLTAGRASQVATARIALAPNAQQTPLVRVSASVDGRVVLLAFDVPEARGSLFVIRPESGDARLLLRGEIKGATISADGARVAVGRNDQDSSLTGLWIGTPDGALRRLIADDPHSNGSPPLPYAFSADGALLVFGVGLGDSGRQGVVIAASSKEGRIDRSGGGAQVVEADASVVGPAAGAEFRSAREIFVWSSRTLFGGQTLAYLYDLTTKRVTDLYRPTGDTIISAAAWRPSADQYASIEWPQSVAGTGLLERGAAAWLRGGDGSGRKLGDFLMVVDIWWSRDGARLFARMGGDDAVGGITDLFTGKGVMQLCVRGGGPPPAPCT
jgi:hypothetical protein